MQKIPLLNRETFLVTFQIIWKMNLKFLFVSLCKKMKCKHFTVLLQIISQYLLLCAILKDSYKYLPFCSYVKEVFHPLTYLLQLFTLSLVADYCYFLFVLHLYSSILGFMWLAKLTWVCTLEKYIHMPKWPLWKK